MSVFSYQNKVLSYELIWLYLPIPSTSPQNCFVLELNKSKNYFGGNLISSLGVNPVEANHEVNRENRVVHVLNTHKKFLIWFNIILTIKLYLMDFKRKFAIWFMLTKVLISLLDVLKNINLY